MSGRHYTKLDVEAEAGHRKPWQTQQKFCKELNIGHMGDIAARYARAAGEAKNASDLGRLAAQASAGAGGLDGGPIVDAEGRINKDHRALQSGGDDIDRVVRTIVRGMNRAIDANDQVLEDIAWMDWRYNQDLKIYAQECNALANAYNLALAEQKKSGSGLAPLSVDYNPPIRTDDDLPQPLMLAPTPDASGNPTFALSQSLFETIRTKYLRLSAKHAGWAYGTINDHIDAYRKKMMEEAAELSDLGYELTEGPFGLYMTPGMAQFAARKLQEELAKKKPDPHVLDLYTEGLRTIAEAIYGDPTKGGPASRHLSLAERAYLRTFFDTLDAEALARLGNLEGLPNPKRSVANGIQMLTNGGIGGFDLSNPANRAHLPASIREFVYDYGNGDMADPQNAEAFRKALDEFNGFGGLMTHASVASGYAFSQDLARAAVGVEKLVAVQQMGPDSAVRNTGSSGLLEASALNTPAAANLLTDPLFRAELLSQGWDDSTGAGAFIDSGTTRPAHVDPNSPLGKSYLEAAKGVLAYVGDRGTGLIHMHDGPSGGYSDLTHLHRSIGDVAIRNMTSIASDGQTIDGQFEFTQGQRKGLISFMNETEGGVRNEFFDNVGKWQYRTALAAFELGDDAEKTDGFMSAFRRIGIVQGTIADVQDRSDDLGTAASTINAIGTFASAAPGPVGVVGALAAGAGAAGNIALSDVKPDMRGFIEARVAIANAAINAEYKDAGEHADHQYRFSKPPAMAESVLGMEGLTGPQNAFKRGFDDYSNQ